MKNSKLQSLKIFELIINLISKLNLVGMIRHLFKISNMSTSWYYKFLKSNDIRKSKESKDI